MIMNLSNGASGQRFANAKRQRGMSLIEMALVLAIIGGLVVIALDWFNSAQTSKDKTIFAQQTTGLLAAVRGAYNNGYAGATSPTEAYNHLKATDRLPSNMDTGSGIRNIFGGSYSIQGINSGAAFTMTITNVPKDICIDTAVSGGFDSYRIDVNSTADFNGDEAAARAACGSEHANQIVLYSY